MRSLCTLSGVRCLVTGTRYLEVFVNHLLVFCQRFGGQGLRANALAQRDAGRDSACCIVRTNSYIFVVDDSLSEAPIIKKTKKQQLLYNRRKPTRYVCTPPTIYLVLCPFKPTRTSLTTYQVPLQYQYEQVQDTPENQVSL